MKTKCVAAFVLVSVFMMSCSTTTSFVVYDESTGSELKDYTIQIGDTMLHYGETISLSNAAWEEYNAIVRKDGYVLKRVHLQKEVKVAPLIIGMILLWIPLLWCYGPKANQSFMLVKG